MWKVTVCVALLAVVACKSGPSITAAKIRRDIAGHDVGDALTSWGDAFPWKFQPGDSTVIKVVETKAKGDLAKVVVDAEVWNTTYDAGHHFWGRMRLHYERIAGEWLLRGVENLDFGDHKPRD